MAVVVVEGFVVVVAGDVVVVDNDVVVDDEVVVGSVVVVVVEVLDVVEASAVVDVVSATPDSPPPKIAARTKTPNSPAGMKKIGRLQNGRATVGSVVMTLSYRHQPGSMGI